MRRERKLILCVFLSGLVVYPLGGLLAGNSLAESVTGYGYFTVLASVPHVAHAVFTWPLVEPAQTWLPLRVALWVDLVSTMVLSLTLQTHAWTLAPTDAQGALVFLVVPFVVAIGAGAAGVVALLGTWVATAVRRRA